MINKPVLKRVFTITSLIFQILCSVGIFILMAYTVNYYLNEIHPYHAKINTILQNAKPEHIHLPQNLTTLIEADLDCINPEKLTSLEKVDNTKQVNAPNCQTRKDDIITNMLYTAKPERHLIGMINRLLVSRLIVSGLSEKNKNTLFCELTYFGNAKTVFKHTQTNHGNRLNPIYGCVQFAQYRFDKLLKALSLEESAILIAITKSPSYYSVPKQVEQLEQRKQLLLDRVKSAY